MPIKRRLAKSRQFRITQRAIEAYRASDSQALHLELNLRPWWPSPLPLSVCGLGVDQGPAPDYWNEEHWVMMQELQRELERAENGH